MSVPRERFGEVEDQIAIDARQRVQPLERSVEDVERGVVTELAERLGNLVLDFFLVERPRERCLVCGRAGLFRLLPSIVEDDDVQFAHEFAGDYKANRCAFTTRPVESAPESVTSNHSDP